MYYADPGVSPYAFVGNDPLNRYDVRGLLKKRVEYRWESWHTWFNRNSSNYWTAENGGGGPIGPTTWGTGLTAGGKNAVGGGITIVSIKETRTGYSQTGIGDDEGNFTWSGWEKYVYDAEVTYAVFTDDNGEVVGNYYLYSVPLIRNLAMISAMYNGKFK